MNIFTSIIVLITSFILYKYTYFFNKKWHKFFQYSLIVFLFSLALIDFAIGNKILKEDGFTLVVGINFFLALLLLLSGGKVIK